MTQNPVLSLSSSFEEIINDVREGIKWMFVAKKMGFWVSNMLQQGGSRSKQLKPWPKAPVEKTSPIKI